MINSFTLLSKIDTKMIFVFIFFLSFLINSAQSIKIEKYLSKIKVTDIKNDGKDIWVTSEGNGIFKYSYRNKKWQNFSTKNKKIKQDFFHCVETSYRYIWAGSTNGLYIYDKKRKKWKRKGFSKGGQFGNWIRSLKYDRKKRTLWIGRFRHLSKYDLRKNKYYSYDLTIKKNEKTNSIKSLYLDGDSLLWIGAEAGLHKFNKKGNISKKRGLSFHDSNKNYFLNEGDQVSITKILAEQNSIWFGTDEFITEKHPNFNIGGLYKYDRGIDWTKVTNDGIYDFEVVGNNIWVASYQFDLENKKQIPMGITIINRLNMKTVRLEADEIPITLNALHFDGSYIWLGTNDGVRRIDLTNQIVPNFNKQEYK